MIRKLIHHKTHVLYLQLTTDESRKYRKIGGYTMVEFGEEIERLGCTFMKVGSKDKIEASLFKGSQCYDAPHLNPMVRQLPPSGYLLLLPHKCPGHFS